MSEFTLPRFARLRVMGGALWLLVKGGGLGLGWCIAVFVGLAALVIAAQPDSGLAAWTVQGGRHGYENDPRAALVLIRIAFFMGSLFGLVGAYLASRSLEKWWAEIWGDAS